MTPLVAFSIVVSVVALGVTSWFGFLRPRSNETSRQETTSRRLEGAFQRLQAPHPKDLHTAVIEFNGTFTLPAS